MVTHFILSFNFPLGLIIVITTIIIIYALYVYLLKNL